MPPPPPPPPPPISWPRAPTGPRTENGSGVGREERPTPETRAGLRKVRFHDLRHTEATLLLTEGVHPKVVQERLGHATIAITLDTYSHVVEGMQREAANRLDIPLGS